MELLVRFGIGGLIVSLFALIGELFTPKTFAGLFGAAPSVALATLGLAYAKESAVYAATEAKSMIAGAVALAIYSALVGQVVMQKRIPPWLGAAALWAQWLLVAFGIWALALRGRA